MKYSKEMMVKYKIVSLIFFLVFCYASYLDYSITLRSPVNRYWDVNPIFKELWDWGWGLFVCEILFYFIVWVYPKESHFSNLLVLFMLGMGSYVHYMGYLSWLR